MLPPNVIYALVFLLSAFSCGVHSLDYSDLEALGAACSDRRDRCRGYRFNMSFTDRSCECDLACSTYKDCCIDAAQRRPSRRNSIASRMTCMPYGGHDYRGVYVIANCESNWAGSSQLRQKCEGSLDLSDPLNAAPVISVAQGITYRNRYCAECNRAYMPTLKAFQLKMSCGLHSLTEEQVFADLQYNRTMNSWGIKRLNSFRNSTDFTGCYIAFDVQEYLNSSVRFCRPNIISNCPPEWKRQQVRKNCQDYMAVVYDNEAAYRNPHCAICNNRTVDEISCKTDFLSRKRPISFAHFLDINQSETDRVGYTRTATPQCPANNIYDPFLKQCRRFACALPGHEVVNGRCVRG